MLISAQLAPNLRLISARKLASKVFFELEVHLNIFQHLTLHYYPRAVNGPNGLDQMT